MSAPPIKNIRGFNLCEVFKGDIRVVREDTDGTDASNNDIVQQKAKILAKNPNNAIIEEALHDEEMKDGDSDSSASASCD